MLNKISSISLQLGREGRRDILFCKTSSPIIPSPKNSNLPKIKHTEEISCHKIEL